MHETDLSSLQALARGSEAGPAGEWLARVRALEAELPVDSAPWTPPPWLLAGAVAQLVLCGALLGLVLTRQSQPALEAVIVAAPALPTEPPEVVEPTTEPAAALAPVEVAPPCAAGRACAPVRVATFPFVDEQSTATAEDALIDAYGCAPDADESGPERWYRVEVPAPGVLVAAIREDPLDGVDVDLHLLFAPDAQACLSRHNSRVSSAVEPGTYWLVVDTFVDAGLVKAGAYQLTVTHQRQAD